MENLDYLQLSWRSALNFHDTELDSKFYDGKRRPKTFESVGYLFLSVLSLSLLPDILSVAKSISMVDWMLSGLMAELALFFIRIGSTRACFFLFGRKRLIRRLITTDKEKH